MALQNLGSQMVVSGPIATYYDPCDFHDPKMLDMLHDKWYALVECHITWWALISPGWFCGRLLTTIILYYD